MSTTRTNLLQTAIEPCLLIGSGGMLGRAWRELLGQTEHRAKLPHAFPSHQELDITEPPAIDRWLTDRYRWVVNCSAYTNVDGAETEPDRANRLNGEAVGQLARRCASTGATLIHYSTDYVFNGVAKSPYCTDTPRDPINAYGRSKAIGEQAIEESGCRFLIIRTSWLYAPWGNHFPKAIARLARQRDMIRVVNDQRGRPTDSIHLAANSMALHRQGATGIYHVTDGGECTWHEFASEIVHALGLRCRVDPCTTAEFPRPAKRPAYSVLDLSQTEAKIGPMNHWKNNLPPTIAALRDMES